MSSRTNPVSERDVNLALHAIIGVSQSQSERLVRITNEANLRRRPHDGRTRILTSCCMKLNVAVIRDCEAINYTYVRPRGVKIIA